jgi:hypothetical protein
MERIDFATHLIEWCESHAASIEALGMKMNFEGTKDWDDPDELHSAAVGLFLGDNGADMIVWNTGDVEFAWHR